MSDKRASELPTISTVGPNDQLYVVSSGFSATTTAAALKTFIGTSDVPAATTTVAGKVVLATAGDVTSVDRAVTPAILASGLSTKAASIHTHSGYASDVHTHTEYAASAHTHSGYAATGHTHVIADTTGLQTALDGKSPVAHTHSGYAATTHSHLITDVTGLQTTLDLKASLASPTLTGTPTAPTATVGTSSTQLATTAFVQAAVSASSTVSSVEIVAVTTATRTLGLTDAGKVLRFTDTAAKTLTVSSTTSHTPNSIFHVTNRGTAGNLVLTGSGVTLNPPKGGALTLEPGDTVSIHMVSATVADVYGSTLSV